MGWKLRGIPSERNKKQNYGNCCFYIASAIQKRMIHLFLCRRSVTRCSEESPRSGAPRRRRLEGVPSKDHSQKQANHSQIQCQTTRKVLATYSQSTRKVLANYSQMRMSREKTTRKQTTRTLCKTTRKLLANYSQTTRKLLANSLHVLQNHSQIE